MGYIELPTGIASFDKAVISIWFRIPSAAITAAVTDYEGRDIDLGYFTDQNLPGIIPLVVFGAPSDSPNGSSRSCIGVSCGHYNWTHVADEEPLPTPHMYALLQYDTGDLFGASDCFQVGGGPIPFTNLEGVESAGSFINVSPNQWHHILVSFDMSTGCSVELGGGEINFSGTECQFWWAFDGVNYDQEYLYPGSPFNYPDETGGSNDIVSMGVLSGTPSGESFEPFSFAAGDLPTSGVPIGIPASSNDADYVYNIQMAEVQIFTDVSLDTSGSISAFISEGSPAPPALAIALLGKEPEFYFRTHNDFITGNNRGTAGDFTPTGTISPYTPGP